MIRQKGFTVIELLVTMAILGVVLGGVFSAYVTQVQHTTREYKTAQAEMEFGIAKNMIERDIAMAGYGLADDYSAVAGFAPRAISATNGGAANTPDTLTVTGTALGIKTKAAQGWTYISSVSTGPPALPTFGAWGDAREDVSVNDWVILMEPASKKLITNGAGTWKFQYKGSGADFSPALTTFQAGTLVYGTDANPTQPYATVSYSLGADAGAPAGCAPGTQTLLRTEFSTAAAAAADVVPLQSCVLDFQVALGLDTTAQNSSINLWDNGGAAAGAVDAETLKKEIRQVRLYLLVQTANQDANYTYPAATIRVGDALLATGEDFTLTAAQRNYRWKVIALTLTPRNIR